MVVPSGECLRGEGLVLLTGVVVCSPAAATGPNCSFTARAMDGPRCPRCSTIGSCRSIATSDDCKARLQVRFPCKTRYIRISDWL